MRNNISIRIEIAIALDLTQHTYLSRLLFMYNLMQNALL